MRSAASRDRAAVCRALHNHVNQCGLAASPPAYPTILPHVASGKDWCDGKHPEHLGQLAPPVFLLYLAFILTSTLRTTLHVFGSPQSRVRLNFSFSYLGHICYFYHASGPFGPHFRSPLSFVGFRRRYWRLRGFLAESEKVHELCPNLSARRSKIEALVPPI